MTPEELAALLPPNLAKWARQLCAAELCYQVDPLLMAAILHRETRGGEGDGYAPKGAAGLGDGGHGHGLFQIDDRSHHRFINATFSDGTPLWKDAAQNTMYAARLFSDDLIGAGKETVVAIAAFNAGLHAARRAVEHLPRDDAATRLLALDAITTGGDYVSDVLKSFASYKGAPDV